MLPSLNSPLSLPSFLPLTPPLSFPSSLPLIPLSPSLPLTPLSPSLPLTPLSPSLPLTPLSPSFLPLTPLSPSLPLTPFLSLPFLNPHAYRFKYWIKIICLDWLQMKDFMYMKPWLSWQSLQMFYPNILTEIIHFSTPAGGAVSADDFLPCFIYVVLKANPTMLHSNVQ